MLLLSIGVCDHFSFGLKNLLINNLSRYLLFNVLKHKTLFTDKYLVNINKVSMLFIPSMSCDKRYFNVVTFLSNYDTKWDFNFLNEFGTIFL